MNRSVSVMVRAALLLAGGVAAVPAQTPPPPQSTLSSSRLMTPNFRDLPVEQVAAAVGEVTGVTFIVAPNVRANVSLINPTAMSATQLYYAFLSMLQVHGFAAQRSGQIVKIVQEANVRTTANDPSPLSGGPDDMVTEVIEARNINANSLATVLRQLVASYGTLQPMPGSNSIVINDRASNVARIRRIVARVDQASNSNIDVIRLENASAGDLVRTLNALTAGQPADAAAGLTPRIAADDRTNSILVSGDPSQRLRMSTWIAHLDTPLEDGGGTETRYLKYADAEKLANLLKGQAAGIAAAATGTAGAAAAATASGGDRSVNIWGHKETNALVITAPPKTMRQLWSIVDKLDIARAQVQIEAIIVDVSTTKSADLGVNWAVYSNEQGSLVPAGAFVAPVAGASIVNLVAAARDPAAAVSAGAIPGGATFAVGQLAANGLNWAAMIRAFRQDRNANVIATPSATTSDNQEAQLKVAQEVPFITGQYTNTGSTNNGQVNPFTTVERQEVGTILKVKPQINGGNALTLEISIESSELLDETGDAGSRITAKRSITTNVLVDDGQILVIGGLIRDADLNGETRVPFLGRIPLIGEAFRVRSKDRAKANLMVFIRAKILADSRQASIETNSKYNLMRDAQRAQGRSKGDMPDLIPLLPGVKAPQLPPIEAPPPLPAAPAAAPPG
ncbi:MAG TPA: type II secretion system secretin GspD [Steroidobacteraceae bacterium]|nr:type II secretion system secretin GspD [Steroidobacteraceae bacterium]